MIDDAGDPNGTPVVYLHGGGDSQLTRHPDDSIAASLGIRLLAVDRSGALERKRTLRRWAARVVAELPVERFAVVGWSAGGPHAIAVAAVAPDRVKHASLVTPMPPPDHFAEMPDDVRKVTKIAKVVPWWAAYELEKWSRQPLMSTGDEACDEAYRRGRTYAFRDGGRCLAHELTYLSRRWDIDLAAVRAPVTVWVGSRDTTCPPSFGDVYAERLPSATVRLVDDGHQLLFTRWREILADAAQQTRQ